MKCPWSTQAPMLRGPIVTYIPSARVKLELSQWGFALGLWGFVWGPLGFTDINMLVSTTRTSRVGAVPNVKPQRKWFCVAVEYRLKSYKELRP